MGRAPNPQDPDRFLNLRNGWYYYQRRVPTRLLGLVNGPLVKRALKTKDLALARLKRDAYEAADNDLWASMITSDKVSAARKRYMAAINRAEALGFQYKSIMSSLQGGSLEDILSRIEAVRPDAPADVEAVVGLVEPPKVLLSEAWDIYKNEIVADQLNGKSKGQRRDWEKVKKRAVNTFIEVVGDLPMVDITREHAIKFRKHWLQRMNPTDGSEPIGGSLANRDIGNMRTLYREYFAYIGDDTRQNPFDGLSVEEKTGKRASYTAEFIKEHFLQPGPIMKLNPEARAIFLACIETGARPSEIANLTPEQIILDHPIPHIKIEPRIDPKDPREIKTTTSIRDVPLVGVSLAVMKRWPKGFPRYKDSSDALSAVLMKWLGANKLRPTKKHTVYSIRHAFETRMRLAEIEDDKRRKLMGHKVDRPEYGDVLLQWLLTGLRQIELPFDPSIVEPAPAHENEHQ